MVMITIGMMPLRFRNRVPLDPEVVAVLQDPNQTTYWELDEEDTFGFWNFMENGHPPEEDNDGDAGEGASTTVGADDIAEDQEEPAEETGKTPPEDHQEEAAENSQEEEAAPSGEKVASKSKDTNAVRKGGKGKYQPKKRKMKKKNKAKPKRTYNALASSDDTEYESDSDEEKAKKNQKKGSMTIQIRDW